MVLASLIPPSQPSRDPDSVSYQKPESQGLLCKDPPSLSFLHWTFLYCSYDVLLRRLFFFFNLTNGFLHYSQHFNDR